MVEHEGEVASRGGALYRRKDTCTAASAHAEVSYLSLTFLRYYTLEVHPLTPIGNFFEDTMHGNMRHDIAPPAPPHTRTATSPQPTATHNRHRPTGPLDWHR
eukprot:832086-Pyramimonas_sp.AAC.1